MIGGAIAAEGRGAHLMSRLRGRTIHVDHDLLYEEVARPDADWNLLEQMVEPGLDDPILDAAVLSSGARAAALRAMPTPQALPGVSFQQVEGAARAAMPPSVQPRGGEPMAAAS